MHLLANILCARGTRSTVNYSPTILLVGIAEPIYSTGLMAFFVRPGQFIALGCALNT